MLKQPVEAFDLLPLSSRVGVEVSGIDLADLSSDGREFILDAYHEHSALLFRNQKLSDEDLIAFSRNFGELEQAPEAQLKKAVPGMPEVYVVSNVKGADGRPIGSLGAGEATWHSDMSSRVNPPQAILLYALELPPAGGDTWVAGMVAALEDMSSELRSKIEGRYIKHDGTYNAAGLVRHGVVASDDPLTCEGRLHPAICIDPASGKPMLFLGRRRNAHIDGLSLDESEKLLDELWAHATSSAFSFSHKWRVGDLLMWNNRSTLHRRDAFDPEHRRVMHRTLIKSRAAPAPA